jgi:hypothetical protein
MKPWSLLQDQIELPDEVRARLRKPGVDHELRRLNDSSSWWIRPVKYHGNEGAAHVADPARPETMAFAITPQFTKVYRWGCRIRCLPAVAGGGDPLNTRIFDNRYDASDLTTSASVGLTIAVSSPAAAADDANDGPPLNSTRPSQMDRPAGSVVDLLVKAKGLGVGSMNSLPTDEWVLASVPLKELLNLESAAGGQAERALGAWVRSDRCGATLNFQLSSGIGYGKTMREWYVTLDWMGWRYIRFDQSETSKRLFNYAWPYNQEGSQRAWGRTTIDVLNLYISNVTTSSCQTGVGTVEALHETAVRLVGAVLSLGSAVSLQVPHLEVGDYFECVDAAIHSTCRAFHPNGTLVPHQYGATKAHAATHFVPEPDLAVKFDPAASAARATIIILEASDERIGPYTLDE